MESSTENLLNRDDIVQVVFTKTARSMNGLWVLNRVQTAEGETLWSLLNLKVSADAQYRLMTTEKAVRVAAKHLSTLHATGFTRDDFRKGSND